MSDYDLLMALVRNGTITVNEARKQMGMKPLNSNLRTIVRAIFDAAVADGVKPSAAIDGICNAAAASSTAAPMTITDLKKIIEEFDTANPKPPITVFQPYDPASLIASREAAMKGLADSFVKLGRSTGKTMAVLNTLTNGIGTWLTATPVLGDEMPAESQRRAPDPIPEVLHPDRWLASVAKGA